MGPLKQGKDSMRKTEGVRLRDIKGQESRDLRTLQRQGPPTIGKSSKLSLVQDLSQLVKLEERNLCVLDCSFGTFKSPVLVIVSKGRDIHAPTGGPVAKILKLCCFSYQRALCRRPHPVRVGRGASRCHSDRLLGDREQKLLSPGAPA